MFHMKHPMSFLGAELFFWPFINDALLILEASKILSVLTLVGVFHVKHFVTLEFATMQCLVNV